MTLTFPVLDNFVYLNTPEQGLLSQELVDYKTNLSNRVANDPLFMMQHRAAFLEETRQRVSHFLDADYHLTALTPNFSIAYNALLEKLPRSTKFLLIDGDYPSLNFPVSTLGFPATYIPLNDRLEESILDAVGKHQPDVLCLSLVQYISGIKIDLEFLKELKSLHPDLVIIADATQYIGVEEFRFRESGIDILAASCYKWMHAGNGNAFMCFTEEAEARLRLYLQSTKNPEEINERGSFIGHFEPGHHDLIAFGALKKATELIQSYGIDRIKNSVDTIALRAKEEFSSRRLLHENAAKRKVHSSIFNLNLEDQILENLLSYRILCCKRGEGIRVGFHFFNTTDDLNQLLHIIDRYS